jgi:hypothetical protein
MNQDVHARPRSMLGQETCWTSVMQGQGSEQFCVSQSGIKLQKLGCMFFLWRGRVLQPA